MNLGEMLDKMRVSDRLIVQDEEDTELYRGFAASTIYKELPREAEVTSFGLYTDTFRRLPEATNLLQLAANRKAVPERIELPPGCESDFKFSDLEFVIYTMIKIKK
jgi:hypothetical protein